MTFLKTDTETLFLAVWQSRALSAGRPGPRRKIASFCDIPPPKDKEMSALPPALDDRDGKIWMDGDLVDWREAKIHVLSHTLHYGCGAFEGVRAYNTVNGTAIFRLQDHTDRLFNSAKILRMQLPFSREQFNAAQQQVVKVNKLESCYIRPLVW